jgi:hypothetical protein
MQSVSQQFSLSLRVALFQPDLTGTIVVMCESSRCFESDRTKEVSSICCHGFMFKLLSEAGC